MKRTFSEAGSRPRRHSHWFYFGRVAGGHCDHRYPGWFTPASRTSGPRSCKTHAMLEQRQATWLGSSQFRVGVQAIALQRPMRFDWQYNDGIHDSFRTDSAAPIHRAKQRLQSVRPYCKSVHSVYRYASVQWTLFNCVWCVIAQECQGPKLR